MNSADYIGKNITSIVQEGSNIVFSFQDGQSRKLGFTNLTEDEVSVGVEGSFSNLIGPPIVWFDDESEGPVTNEFGTYKWILIRIATVLGSVKILFTSSQTGENRLDPEFDDVIVE